MLSSFHALPIRISIIITSENNLLDSGGADVCVGGCGEGGGDVCDGGCGSKSNDVPGRQ